LYLCGVDAAKAFILKAGPHRLKVGPHHFFLQKSLVIPNKNSTFALPEPAKPLRSTYGRLP